MGPGKLDGQRLMDDYELLDELLDGDAVLEDLYPPEVTCGILDPGPDPTFDPGRFPEDDDVPAKPLKAKPAKQARPSETPQKSD